MFGRMTKNGNVRLLDDDGMPMNSLPECCSNIYPVNNQDEHGINLSACYGENLNGFILTLEDAKKIGLEIEDE